MRQYKNGSCLATVIFFLAIFICGVFYEFLFNQHSLLDSLRNMLSTSGMFILVMFVIGFVVIIPIMLMQIKRSNKRFIDSLGYKKRK